MSSRLRKTFGQLLLIITFVAMPASTADRSLEYAVKATFLFKFASFVEWPAGSFEHETSPFSLCIAGDNPFGERINDAVQGQSVGRHPIVLRKVAMADPKLNCHAMFVSASQNQRATDALELMKGTPTLTITDSRLGSAAGIIHFVMVDDRVSFDIDNVAAATNQLVISSKLLAIARRVNTRHAGSPR